MLIRRPLGRTHPQARFLALRLAPGAAVARGGALEFARAIMARYGSVLARYHAVPLLHLVGLAGLASPGAAAAHRWLTLAVSIDLRLIAMGPAAAGPAEPRPRPQQPGAPGVPAEVLVYLETVKDRLVRETRWREVLRVPRPRATAPMPGTAPWTMQFESERTTLSAAPVFLADGTSTRASEIIVGRTGLARITHSAPLHPQASSAEVESLRWPTWRMGIFHLLPLLTMGPDAYQALAEAGGLGHAALLPAGSRARFLVGQGIRQAATGGQRTASRAGFRATTSRTSIRATSGGRDVRTGPSAARGAGRPRDSHTVHSGVLLIPSHQAATFPPRRLPVARFGGSRGDAAPPASAPGSLLEVHAAGPWPFAAPAGQARVAPGGRADTGDGRVTARDRSRHRFAPAGFALARTVVAARHFHRLFPALAMAGADPYREAFSHLITVFGPAPRRTLATPSDEAVTGHSVGAVGAHPLRDDATAPTLRLFPRASAPPPRGHPHDEALALRTHASAAGGQPGPRALPGPQASIFGSGSRRRAGPEGSASHRPPALLGAHPAREPAPLFGADHLHHPLDLRGPSAAPPTAGPSTAFRRYRRAHPVSAGVAWLRHVSLGRDTWQLSDRPLVLERGRSEGSFDRSRHAGRGSPVITASTSALVVPPATAIPRARALPDVRLMALGSRADVPGLVPAAPTMLARRQRKPSDQEPLWGRPAAAAPLVPAAPPGRGRPPAATPSPPARVGPGSAAPGGTAEVVRLPQPPSRTVDVPTLADAVYRLIVDRVRREKHMRGL